MSHDMSTDERHVHIYLGTPEPGVHVHIHLGDLGDEASKQVTREPTVEGNLKRLKDYNSAHAENIQAAYDGLVALGLTPHVPITRNPGQTVQPYLRWTHDNHPSGSVAYLNAATLSFAGKNDLARVVRLPGAADRGSEVRFSILSPEGVAQALAATRLVVGAG